MELMNTLKQMVPWRKKSVEPHDVVTLKDDIDRLFDRFWAGTFDEWPLRGGRLSWPAIDLDESDDEVVVHAELPGVEPRDLDVSIRDGILHVRYEQKDEHEQNGRYVGRYGSFARSIRLPEGLDTAAARAKCQHGLLTVRIPRTAEAKQRVRRIPVQG